MKLLIDESLPKQLKHFLQNDYEVMTVPERGWAGKQNGDLLRLAASEFDVFLTMDKNLKYQQNLKVFDIAIVVLIAYSNQFEDVEPLIPQIQKTLETLQPKDYFEIT